MGCPERHDHRAAASALTSSKFADLVRACAPALQNLLSETTGAPELPLFGEQAREKAQEFYSEETLAKLSARERKAAEDAAELYRYFERKGSETNFAPAFNVLLGPFDEAAKALILKLLRDKMPAGRVEQENWFEPYLRGIEPRFQGRYQNMARNLKRGLVYGNPHSVIGLLCACFDVALNDQNKLGGVFTAVRESFRLPGSRKVLDWLVGVNEFRNTYVAHHEKDLHDKAMAESNLKRWIETLALLKVY